MFIGGKRKNKKSTKKTNEDKSKKSKNKNTDYDDYFDEMGDTFKLTKDQIKTLKDSKYKKLNINLLGIKDLCVLIKIKLMKKELKSRREYLHLKKIGKKPKSRVRWFYLQYENYQPNFLVEIFTNNYQPKN